MGLTGEYKTTSYQDARNAALYEPRISYIKGLLEKILSMVELVSEGRAVEVDGFRLKDLQDWLVRSSCDPIEVFGYAGSRCNIACGFCYNRGNPPSLVLGNLPRSPKEEYHDMMTRLRYFRPRAGLSLYPALGDIYEILNHPHILDVLRPLRQLTPKPFRIGTNGAVLTPRFIEKLSELMPLYLYISVEGVSQAHEFQTASSGAVRIPMRALQGLKDAGVPYALVFVPWPVKRPLGEVLETMTETVELGERCQAHMVEINLPGYTRHFSAGKLFDLQEVWSAAVAHVRKLRENYSIPIVAMPTMYEETHFEPIKNLPCVIGVVKNSPAQRAEVRRGDVVEKLNSVRIISRPQARDLLSIIRGSGARTVHMTVRRGGEEIEKEIDTADHCYPYIPEIDQHLGIITLGTGLRVSYIEELRNLIEERGAKRALFLSSALVKPLFEQLLSESPLFAGSEISVDIEVPPNTLLGGNIFMGDLLMVQDFIDAIRDYLKSGKGRPDLVVIPSSPFNLGGWGRDLTGRCYLEIERAAGVPVALLQCSTIYD